MDITHRIPGTRLISVAAFLFFIAESAERTSLVVMSGLRFGSSRQSWLFLDRSLRVVFVGQLMPASRRHARVPRVRPVVRVAVGQPRVRATRPGGSCAHRTAGSLVDP